MLIFRPASTRGTTFGFEHNRKTLDTPWIESRRVFSNNSYWHPRYMNFEKLEVINDDILNPTFYVPEHEHKNMEIFGYVVEGPCTHVDSLGNEHVAQSGEVQFMSCGSGIRHTEGNFSDHPIRYLQIWIEPRITDTPPEYSNRQFSRDQKLNKFCKIAGETGPLYLKQNANFYAGIFEQSFNYRLDIRKKYYLYVIIGECTINNQSFTIGDSCSLVEEQFLDINPTESCEVLLFEF